MKLLVTDNAASTALKALGDKSKLIYIDIPAANEAAALTELALISTDDYFYSDDVEGVSGSSTDTILLPEKITENG